MTGRSAKADGLAGAEAPEPCGLGPTGGIPSAGRRVPIPEQIAALGAVLANLDGVWMTDNDRAEALVWAWEGMRDKGVSVTRTANKGARQ